MKLVFIDPTCPRPYDPEVLATQGLGGTEATVVRVASALSADNEVTVFQHNRKSVWLGDRGLCFKPMDSLEQHLAQADHLVFIQKAQGLSRLARHSRGSWWLWLHNYVQEEVPLFWQDHLRYRLGIICVSRTHAEHTARYVQIQRHAWLTARWALRGGLVYHHNPLNPALGAPPCASYDAYKLCFFSSPHKGLEQVVTQFRRIHEIEPRFRLHVADPGYLKNVDGRQLEHPGIVRLGSLPQTEVLRHVAESLCVFYPQTRRAETFGLVYAEANAVGTPVLAHDFGSAREILVADNPPTDAANTENVQRILFDWKHGHRPKVSADPRCCLATSNSGLESFLCRSGSLHPHTGLAMNPQTSKAASMLTARSQAPSDGKRILISILNWNSTADTLSCLQPLGNLSEIGIDCVVLDNGSAVDPTAQIMAAHPNVEVRRVPVNLGFTGGHNLMFKLAFERGYGSVTK